MTKIFIFCSWDTCSHFPKAIAIQILMNTQVGGIAIVTEEDDLVS